MEEQSTAFNLHFNPDHSHRHLNPHHPNLENSFLVIILEVILTLLLNRIGNLFVSFIKEDQSPQYDFVEVSLTMKVRGFSCCSFAASFIIE